ncbi:tetratricopeptide repeat protein [Novosphingobium soli]|uniref:Tetratricopeptide repeat protein n=1 Tax=Novosphingobium soli TaxID=574956 RepID=A0ABV6CVM9_9SPHN
MRIARGARWVTGAALLASAAGLGAEPQDPRLVEIVGLIREGRQAEAVARADAMIAGFAAEQHARDVSYYCNRDRGGVANLMGAARQGAKVDLAPEAWCEALFAKGFALTDLGRFDEAGAALSQAVAMDPTNPHFRNQYGDILRLRGDAAGAIAQYHQAYDLAAADGGEITGRMATRALRGLALASESQGDLAAAQSYYEALLQQDAQDGAARAKLADIVRRRAGG